MIQEPPCVPFVHISTSRKGLKSWGRPATVLRLREKAESLQPDLVLTDLSMPQLTGLEAAGAVAEVLARIANYFIHGIERVVSS